MLSFFFINHRLKTKLKSNPTLKTIYKRLTNQFKVIKVTLIKKLNVFKVHRFSICIISLKVDKGFLSCFVDYNLVILSF